ncbi:MAG: hypothetical protein Q8R37_04215 [Nanoarchaeota archaeon]|nr:hypothetical protein [Nanoarchaeota archaeon]
MLKQKGVVKVNDIKQSFSESVRHSVQSRNLDISSWAQEYVAGMLAVFVRSANLFETSLNEKGSLEHFLQPIALSYLEAQNADELRRIGDKCLFLTGFLYDFIRQQGMPQVRYYGDVGSSAYIDFAHSIGKEHRDAKQLYFELARKFWDLSEIIHGIQSAESYSSKTLLDILFKYTQERDPRHYDLLLKNGFIINQAKEDN